MKKKRGYLLVPLALLLVLTLVTTAFGIDEGDVQSAVTEASKEEVAGNIFIWFLCAIGFLKISQKIDSFMSALGISTARTGGSMLAEMMIAGRAVAGAAGHSLGGIFHRGSAFNSGTKAPAAGSAYVTNQFGHGVIGMAQQAAANTAAASVTGKASGVSNAVGSKMFSASMAKGGQLSKDVISSVAMGNISQMGTMTGPTADEALAGYMGYAAAMADEGNTLVDEAEGNENAGTMNVGAGAQPPVGGNVPGSPEGKPGETGVPPVKPSDTDVENMAAKKPGVSHGNVTPVIPVNPSHTSFTPMGVQSGAASPYTLMGTDAGAAIPKEPGDISQPEDVSGTEMDPTPVAATVDAGMSNTSMDTGSQQKAQFAPTGGISEAVENGKVPSEKPFANGMGGMSDTVDGQEIPVSMAATQEEAEYQSKTSGTIPVSPMPAGSSSDPAGSSFEQKVQAEPVAGMAGSYPSGKTSDIEKTPASASAVTNGTDEGAVIGVPDAMQTGANVFQRADSGGIPSDPVSAVESQGTAEKTFATQTHSAPMAGVDTNPRTGKIPDIKPVSAGTVESGDVGPSGIQKGTIPEQHMAGGTGGELNVPVSRMSDPSLSSNHMDAQSKPAEAYQRAVGGTVPTAVTPDEKIPEQVGSGVQPQMHDAPAPGMVSSVVTGPQIAGSAAERTDVRKESHENPVASTAPVGTVNASKQSGHSFNGATPETPSTDAKAPQMPFNTGGSSVTQSPVIPMTAGVTSHDQQEPAMPQRGTESTNTEVSPHGQNTGDYGAAQGTTSSSVPLAHDVSGGSTTAAEAIRNQGTQPTIPTVPGGAAVISTGNANAFGTPETVKSKNTVPHAGPAGHSDTTPTRPSTDSNAAGAQTVPYQASSGSTVSTSIKSSMVNGTTAETTIQQSAGNIGGVEVKPTQSMVTPGGKEIPTMPKGGRSEENYQPVTTVGKPNSSTVPQPPAGNGTELNQSRISTGMLKEVSGSAAAAKGKVETGPVQQMPVSTGNADRSMPANTPSGASIPANPIVDAGAGTSAAAQRQSADRSTGSTRASTMPVMGVGVAPAAETTVISQEAGRAVQSDQHLTPASHNAQSINQAGSQKPEKAEGLKSGREKVPSGRTEHSQIPMNPVAAPEKRTSPTTTPMHSMVDKPSGNGVSAKNPSTDAQGKVSQVKTTNRTVEKTMPGKNSAGQAGISHEVPKAAMDGRGKQPAPAITPTNHLTDRPQTPTQPASQKNEPPVSVMRQAAASTGNNEPVRSSDVRTRGNPVPPKVQTSPTTASRGQTGNTTGKAESPHRAPTGNSDRAIRTPNVSANAPGATTVPQKPPTYTKVEIGGGRITGVETPADGAKPRQFAMYSTRQYTEPKGPHEVVKTVDGESWYKQYAQPTVEKTPKEVTEKGIRYDQKIIDQLPDAPRRKDRI